MFFSDVGFSMFQAGYTNSDGWQFSCAREGRGLCLESISGPDAMECGASGADPLNSTMVNSALSDRGLVDALLSTDAASSRRTPRHTVYFLCLNRDFPLGSYCRYSASAHLGTQHRTHQEVGHSVRSYIPNSQTIE